MSSENIYDKKIHRILGFEKVQYNKYRNSRLMPDDPATNVDVMTFIMRSAKGAW